MSRAQLALSIFASTALIGTAIAAPVAEGGRKFTTTMTGANEVPGPGDPDGTGTARITINPGQARICWELTVSNIASATAAHIHSAPVGVAGPVVLPLSPPSDGQSQGCADVDRSLADAIRKAPQGYYVNVHNSDFPAGAIRGQLG